MASRITPVIFGRFQLEVEGDNLFLIEGGNRKVVLSSTDISSELVGSDGVATAHLLSHTHGVPIQAVSELIEAASKL